MNDDDNLSSLSRRTAFSAIASCCRSLSATFAAVRASEPGLWAFSPCLRFPTKKNFKYVHSYFSPLTAQINGEFYQVRITKLLYNRSFTHLSILLVLVSQRKAT